MSRLKQKYIKEIAPALAREFNITNRMEVPRVVKVVVNAGIGDAVKNKDVLEQAKKDLTRITGQAPSIRAAKRAVASFSLREGMPIGLKVTLRKGRMYDFMDKLFAIVLPRLRDFRGLSLDSFDGQGNYSLGINEHIVFPEIDLTKSGSRGIEVTIVTSTKDKNIARRLLELLGMPFEKDRTENTA